MPESDPTPTDTETLLRNLLQTGALQSLPANPHVLDTVLAVATGGFVRQRPYAEREVNDLLSAWLASVRARIDHVTLRRRMVDLGFLKRTRDGSRYYLNVGRVAGILGRGDRGDRRGGDHRRHRAGARSAQEGIPRAPLSAPLNYSAPPYSFVGSR